MFTVQRIAILFFGVLALALASHPCTATTWVEGQNYVVMVPAQRTQVPDGKIEVMEVFSYACPACNSFQPVMEALAHSLPRNAQLVFLPASFNASEDWPMFQRAYFAAQSLGIAERTHQGIFDAVWKSGELAVTDPVTHRLKRPQPSLQDAARAYARLAGVTAESFLAAANSFSVDLKIRAADAQIVAMQIPGTPCIVVNGKYRIVMASVRSGAELTELVGYLVAKETTRH